MSWLHSPVSFHLSAIIFEVTLVVYAVHASVLLYEVEVISVYLSVNIKHSYIILALAMDVVKTNMHRELHMVILAELLIMTMPSHLRLILTHMWLLSVARLTHWLSVVWLAYLWLLYIARLTHWLSVVWLTHWLSVPRLTHWLSIARLTHLWLSVAYWLLVNGRWWFIVHSWLAICKHDLWNWHDLTHWNLNKHFLFWMPMSFEMNRSCFFTTVTEFKPLI